MAVLNIKNRVKNNKLNLSGLNLTEIPVKQIVPLKITQLDLSNNNISSTDNVFSLLSGLVKLDLSNNRIKSVASDIGSLQKLAYLSLANNKIKDLPNSISELEKLKYLNLSNNPLKSDLAEAVGPSQTNTQCRSAAAKAVQYLKDDSKNHDYKQIKKKDKNHQSKNKTKPKKKPACSASKNIGFFDMFRYILLLAALSTLSLYALSYYDNKALCNAKSDLLPLWESATSNLDPQVASKINYFLKQAETYFDQAIQTKIEESVKFYEWVEENLTVHQYANNILDTWKSLWDSVVFSRK